MGIKERMSGNEAVAYAIKQVNPDVMPAFPNHAVHRDPADGFHIHRKRRDRYRIYPGRE